MKKRIVSLLLALILVVGLVPVTAFAASSLNTSASAIAVLKLLEGFDDEPYTDGTYWYIGYGTQINPADYPNGVTESVATELLQEHLEEVVDKKVNEFAKKHNLTFTQNEHDALALFTYNCGYGWMSETNGYFYNAVIHEETGDEFLYAIALWAGNPSNETFNGLLNRRMVEANMYLNGKYSATAPSNYTYALLDPNGGNVAYTVYGYNTNSTPALEIIPTRTGYTFVGWYLNGTPITELNNNTSRKTLTAKWQKGDEFVGALYILNASKLASQNVYQAADKDSKVVDTLKANADVFVMEEKIVGELKWAYAIGYNKDNKITYGWVCLGKVTDDSVAEDTILATATVTAATLNVRESATTNSDTVTTLKKGQVVNILAYKNEQTSTGTKRWGKVNVNGKIGWINLAYVELKEVSSNDNITVTGITGTVVNTDYVNVRSDAGVHNAQIGTIARGTKVLIKETKKVNNVLWGRVIWDDIKEGWVCMNYIQVSGTGDGLGGSTGTAEKVLYTGVVNVNGTTNLNVRETAGTTGKYVKSLTNGTKVNIYETTMVNGVRWGRTEDGWICMLYVSLNEVNTGNTGSNEKYVTGTVVNCITGVNIRTAPGTTNALVGNAPLGATLKIYEVVAHNKVQWGRTDNGWVCMLYIKLNGDIPVQDDSDPTITTLQGTITATTLNLRKEPTNNAATLANLRNGDVVTILEQKTETTATGSKIWGKVEVDGITGWLNLAYVDLKLTASTPGTNPGTGTDNDNTTGSTGTAVVKSGVIANAAKVNVRSAAGVNNDLVATLTNGTAVKVYEQTTVNNAPWGRIDQGWVCMYYVNLDAETNNNTNNNTNNGTTNNNANGTYAVGVVNSNIDLNVRSGPGVNYGKVAALKNGTRIIILETQNVNGTTWGRTAQGWVSLSYVTLEGSNSNGNGQMGTIARCFSHVNVRSAAGTGNAIVGTIPVGTRVEILEQTFHGGQYWGRVNQGWICMQYVLLDSELPGFNEVVVPSTPSAPEATQPEASEPVEEETKPGYTGTVINTNPQAAYRFTGTVSAADGTLNVRKDATTKADLAGTLSNGAVVNIVALKANEDQTWGKIDEYGTPGWINLAHVNFTITGYISERTLNVRANYTDASEAVDSLKLNDKIACSKVAVEMLEDGTTKVWGKIDTGNVTNYVNDEAHPGDVTGWINMAYVSSVPLTPIFDTTDNVGAIFSGKTFEAVKAYEKVDNTTVVFELTKNAPVYVLDYQASHGIVWAKVSSNGIVGWIDLGKCTFTATGITTDKLNVRKQPMGDGYDTIMGTIEANQNVVICSMIISTSGSIWGQVQSSDATINGGWVNLSYVNM